MLFNHHPVVVVFCIMQFTTTVTVFTSAYYVLLFLYSTFVLLNKMFYSHPSVCLFVNGLKDGSLTKRESVKFCHISSKKADSAMFSHPCLTFSQIFQGIFHVS